MRFIVKEENGKRVGQIVDINQEDAYKMVCYIVPYVDRVVKQFDENLHAYKREIIIHDIELSTSVLEKFDKLYWQLEGEVELDEA